MSELTAAFRKAVEQGDMRTAKRLCKRLAREDPKRWNGWLRAISSGHRIKLATYPAQILAGDDYADLKRIEDATTVADLFEEEA